MNPVPILFAVSIGLVAYLLGGPTVSAWAVAAWPAFCCIATLVP